MRRTNIKKLWVTALISLTAGMAWSDSGELKQASGDLGQASGDLVSAGVQLSGDLAVNIGQPIAEVVVDVAIETGNIIYLGGKAAAKGVKAGAEVSGEALNASGEAVVFVGKEVYEKGKIIARPVKKVVIFTAKQLGEVMVALTKSGVTLTAETIKLLGMIGIDAAILTAETAKLGIKGVELALKPVEGAIYVVANVGDALVISPLQAINSKLKK